MCFVQGYNVFVFITMRALYILDIDNYWNIFETFEYNIEFRLKVMFNSIYVIIDLLCIIIGCITFVFISLHRIPCFCRCIGLLFDTIANKKRIEKYYKMKE